jgi:protoporphyrinogen oxidase
VVRSKYAYVIYDKDYLKNVGIVKNYLEKLGIILCGRFAEFEYLNMDACIQRGRSLAEKINSSLDEESIFLSSKKGGNSYEK